MRKILVFALAALVSCAPQSLDLPRGKASKSMDEAFASYIDATAKADKQEMHSVMVATSPAAAISTARSWKRPG